jgi:endo-1,3-1,4-beta-glycanase ExoK
MNRLSSFQRSVSVRKLLLSLTTLCLLVSLTVRPAYAVGGTFFDALDSYDTSRWYKSDGWTNGNPFNVGWRADHITHASGIMSLRLDNTSCPSGCSGKPYASGEYRTNDFYGYGKFETRLKAAAGSGLVTSFFTYSGPSDGLPHDEIDIEILGKDTTKMQVNYFVNDVGGHEVLVDLGFDAAAAYHNYAIVWSAGSIKWYVDNSMVYMVSATPCTALPSVPGRIMVNLWAGTGVDSWLGPFSYPGTPIYAQYDWIQYFKS